MNSLRDALPETIRTERLVLATPSLDHVPEMARLANNRAIHEVLSRLPHPYGEADGRFFVQTIARGPEEWTYSILLDNRYIGSVGLHLLPDQLPGLGYWLGQPHWGRGYATEAAGAVVGAARATGLIPALLARALLANTASRNVLTKIGFVQTGEAVDQQGTLAGRRVATMRMDFER
jgi:RimJ/RimL family protein N-acetyltransferase